VLGISRCPAGLNLCQPDPDYKSKYSTIIKSKYFYLNNGHKNEKTNKQDENRPLVIGWALKVKNKEVNPQHNGESWSAKNVNELTSLASEGGKKRILLALRQGKRSMHWDKNLGPSDCGKNLLSRPLHTHCGKGKKYANVGTQWAPL